MEEMIYISGTKRRRYSKNKINKPQTTIKKERRRKIRLV